MSSSSSQDQQENEWMTIERADPDIQYLPGQQASEQDLFHVGPTLTVSPPYTQQESHRIMNVVALGLSPRRTFRAAEPFPPARLRSLSWTPSVHRGPADSTSMASSSNLSRLSRLSPPQAPQPDLAREFLERGQPEGARDPMDRPDEGPIGGDRVVADETVERLRASAIRHMAIVWRQLSAAELNQDAEDLNAIFSNRYPVEYDEERGRNIAEEENDTSKSSENSNVR